MMKGMILVVNDGGSGICDGLIDQKKLFCGLLDAVAYFAGVTECLSSGLVD